MEDLWTLVTQERTRAADEFEHLTEAQLATQSQCEAWTVREACAHLILPFELSMPKFMIGMIANRGNMDTFFKKATIKLAEKYTHAEVIAKLRENTNSTWTPPGEGAEVPLGEIVVHGQDLSLIHI